MLTFHKWNPTGNEILASFTVKFRHRLTNDSQPVYSKLGGTLGTTCTIIRPSTNGNTVGCSWLHPKDKNSFSKRVGRLISFRKALDKLNLSKQDRTDAWTAYFREHSNDKHKLKERRRTDGKEYK